MISPTSNCDTSICPCPDAHSCGGSRIGPRRSDSAATAALAAPRRPRVASRKARELEELALAADADGIEPDEEAVPAALPDAAAVNGSAGACKCKKSRCLKLVCNVCMSAARQPFLSLLL